MLLSLWLTNQPVKSSIRRVEIRSTLTKMVSSFFIEASNNALRNGYRPEEIKNAIAKPDISNHSHSQLV
jgi:hypothetical protein